MSPRCTVIKEDNEPNHCKYVAKDIQLGTESYVILDITRKGKYGNMIMHTPVLVNIYAIGTACDVSISLYYLHLELNLS